jgi:hypothetical protein
METSAHFHDLPLAQMFRRAAHFCAILLFGGWLGLIIAEFLQRRVGDPPLTSYYQAAVLAVVFAGYLIGARHEFAGGMLTVLATVTFFVVHIVSLGITPAAAIAWFAAPGVFYLLAWYTDHQTIHRLGRLG